MEKKTIGSFLAFLRKTNGMTQKELAEKLNVSDKSVSRWERDESVPELNLIPILARIFNVTSDELIQGERFSPEELNESKEKEFSRSKNQIEKCLKDSETKLIISSIISIAISMIGLILAAVCNFCFQRAIIGFFLGSALYLIAGVCEMVSLIVLNSRINNIEFDKNAVNDCKQKIFHIAKITLLIIGFFLFVSLPLVIMSWSPYMGIPSITWLLYGLIFGVVAILIYILILGLRKIHKKICIKDN